LSSADALAATSASVARAVTSSAVSASVAKLLSPVNTLRHRSRCAARVMLMTTAALPRSTCTASLSALKKCARAEDSSPDANKLCALEKTSESPVPAKTRAASSSSSLHGA
jgi:hypothetical protein